MFSLNEGSGIPRWGQKPGKSQKSRLVRGIMILTKVVLALRDSSGSTFFVAVLSSSFSHPKQYLGPLPFNVDLREEFLSSAMLKLGLSGRHFVLLFNFFCFIRKALKPRHFSPAVLSWYTHFSGKWHDLQPRRSELQQKLPNLWYTRMREILWAWIIQEIRLLYSYRNNTCPEWALNW